MQLMHLLKHGNYYIKKLQVCSNGTYAIDLLYGRCSKHACATLFYI